MSLTTAAVPFLSSTLSPTTLPPSARLRLTRIEVLNWGTFHRTVWSFNIDGASALLTGAAGSGKSTLVDAMTTLLLPAHKIAYNKAAGAEAKERDLRSYVLGYHKNERVEATDSTRPVALRDATSHSVILGVFTNYSLGTHVTLAQVFWVPDANTSQPDRFFLTADRPLSIEADFTRFGTSITDLRRRLKQTGATLYTSYPPYGKALRRSLGIPSEQALDLFHQTVSMKAVGSLDDFVRERMLEPFDAQAAVDKIVAHFDALTANHAEVVRARQMIEHLTPIVEACDRCDAIQAQITLLTRRRDAVPLFFAQRREDALTQLGSDLHTRIRQLTEEQHKRAQHLDGLRLAAEGLRRRIDGAGGERLVELRARIDELGRERDRRRKRSGEYQSWLERAGLPPVNDPASFHERITQISRAREQATQHEQQARQELDELAVARHANTTATEAIRREILNLHSQRSSIPARLLELRQDLAAAAGVDAEELPFAGELIQVRDSETEWAGAAERVLRSFALSLLVPEAHYANVSQWVNGRHLGLRLVYYRVPAHIRPTELPTDPSFLTGKLELNQDSWYDWLATQLCSRADYHCAGDLDTFTRSTRPAVTKQGLIKNGGGRHEKDDTSRVDDRRSWVLGWTNQAKLTALIEEAQRLTQESAEITERTRALKQQESSRSGIRDALALLANVENHHEIDWQAAVLELEELQQRKQTLETEAGLDKLTTELQEAEEGIKHSTKDFDTSQEHLGSLRNEHKRVAAQLDKTTALLQRADLTDATEHRDALTAFLPGPTDSVQHLLEQLDAAETLAAQQLLHTRESRTEAYRRAASQTATSKMATFRDTYHQFTTDLDSSIEAADGYRQLHNRLTDDDLPRFETQFLQYLRTNVIRDIASFQAHLSAQEQQIRERIEVINASLAAINYNPGRYIRLNAAPTPSVEIRDFRRDLRTCTSDALATDPDDTYTEEKFLQVKQLLDRFKGRPEHTRHDADWTARVTDVRRWFIFNASEVNRADDTEHEVHSDSGGKSGGQKEKLAYTILAASLAYQFRIDSGNSKTFRFVVIDEAFGQGDDPSAHFALDLFQRLGLQLLVVTPLQKLHVIEPHVTRVGYVDRPDTVRSRLNTLTIEEFRAARMKAAQMPGSPTGVSAMTTRHWTSPEDVIESLRRKWNSGRYLAAAAQGHPFEPISVPLKGPTSTDVNRHYSKALEWAQSWAAHHHPHMRIQTKTIGGHHNTPTNTIPIRIWVDTLHQLVTLLQTTAEADLFHSLHDATATTDPALTEWMASHPMKVLKAAPHWQRLIDTVAWFRNHIAAPVYLRQIDVPDVDTKFIEAHQGILGELLDHSLPADRIHYEAPRNDLAARYGLLSKPAYVRLRHLDNPPGPYSELTVRTSELTAAPPGTHTVIVLENEITYLSLPPTPGTTALLGSGYAASLLRHLPWLADIDLWYWGDIDTHGFAILSRVRSHFPHTRSLLMDRHTLLAHRAHWGEEKNQTTEPPAHLTPAEAQLEQDLRRGTYQPHLRLEQERIPISAVAHALVGRTPTTDAAVLR